MFLQWICRNGKRVDEITSKIIANPLYLIHRFYSVYYAIQIAHTQSGYTHTHIPSNKTYFFLAKSEVQKNMRHQKFFVRQRKNGMYLLDFAFNTVYCHLFSNF